MTDETALYYAHGYAAIPALAPPEVARGLLGLITEDMAQPGVARRLLMRPTVNAKPSFEFHSTAYPPVLGFHWGLTSRLCALTGRRLAPTYAFFRAYQKGDVCAVHSDRPSCEHSLSLALGYADDVVWDFDIGSVAYSLEAAHKMNAAPDFGDEPSKQVRLAPGDAILYQGVAYRHGRITPNPNAWSAHLFLHWVDLDGPYKDWAFDRRPPPAPRGFDFTA